MMEFKTSIKF